MTPWTGKQAKNGSLTYRTLRMTPAMAAGVTPRLWDVVDLVQAKKLVVGKIDPRSGSGDLYLTDLASGTSVPITTDPRHEFGPVWSPDGKAVAFARENNAPPYLHKIGLDGGVAEPMVAPSGGVQMATDWLKDGSILYQDMSPVTNTDLMLLPRRGESRVSCLQRVLMKCMERSPRTVAGWRM
jgi:hypothetical protein